MRRSLIFAAVVMMLPPGVFGLPHDAAVGVEIRSTSVIRRTAAGDRQMIRVACTAESDLGTLTIAFSAPGFRGRQAAVLDSVRTGTNVRFVEIPPVKRSDSVRYVLKFREKIIASGRCLFSPPRRRTVYDVEVSHHDLGYADYYHLMRRDVREMGLEMALEFCRKTDDWDENARFHWTVETSEPLTKFISSQPPAVVEELVRRVKEGRIEFGGLHNSVYSEMMSPELMARMFYTPNRSIVDLLGVPPSRTALIDDVVGFTRTLPLFLKEADVPYFYNGYNETVDGMNPASKNPVFYWKANDGDSLRMPLVRSYLYYSPDRLLKYDLPEIAKLLLKYDADPLWGYDCLIAEDSYDFSVPQFENVEGIRRWNERYANPTLRSGTFSMFFDDVMKQADKRAIPVFDEDAPNAWADQDASDGKSMGEARLLNYRLPEVERMATIAFASGGRGYPWKDLWESYHKLLSYHEHTNGAFSEEDVLPIPLLKNRAAANANYYESEQVMHKGLVKEAQAFTSAAGQQAVEALAKLVTVEHDHTFVVFNSLNWGRSGPVRVSPPGAGEWIVRDNATNESVQTQRSADGSLLFEATDVPSMGYRTYRLEEGRGGASDMVRAEGRVISNQFYRITIDSVGGGVESIWDKRRQVELVDRNAPYKLNEYVYQKMDDPGARKPGTYHPRMISSWAFSGPLAAGITTRVRAAGCNAIEQSVSLYANSDVIDFHVKLDKSDSGKMLKQNSNENKEAVFYAMPLNVPGFTIHHELAGGVVEPLDHQFSGSTSNYFGIQHFSDVSNDRYGITVASINAPLVEYGTPRPALWAAPNDAESIIRKPEKSHLFFYLMNNMFFTNIPVSQPGLAEFSWSLRSHDGGWIEGKSGRFGWESSHPLQVFAGGAPHAGVLPEASHSFLSLNCDNVVCSTIKPAEANGEGFILRFLEMNGSASRVRARLNLFGKIASARETNLVEADRETLLAVTAPDEIEFAIGPFGVKTIRVVPDPPDAVGIPRGASALALSDREVELKWTPVRNASFYRVYRGSKPDFTPALINCVGMAAESRYVDRPQLNHGGWLDNRLEPRTDYFYRIEAVGVGNRRSGFSESAAAKTYPASLRNSSPHRVLGLEATNVSPVTGYNYISLLFYTNVESDVVRYRVYRGERPGFTADSTTLLEEIDATRTFEHVTPHAFAKVVRALRDYTMIVYPDESVQPNKQYWYRVCAVDAAGQSGELSDESTAKTEIRRLVFEGSRFFFDSALVDIRPHLSDGSQIRYSTDGIPATAASALYTGPFVLKEPTRVSAAFFRQGEQSPAFSAEAEFQRALYPPPKYIQPFSEKWPGQGVLNMVDGKRGAVYTDACFQGFEQNDMDIIVDLGGKKDISSLAVSLVQDLKAWVFFPVNVEFLISHDGANFEKVGEASTPKEFERKEGSLKNDYAVTFDRRAANFVRVRARNIGLCPSWHGGFEYKGKAWLFADEIVVR